MSSTTTRINETVYILDEVMNDVDEWEASIENVLRVAFLENDELRSEWVEAVIGRKQEKEDEKDD